MCSDTLDLGGEVARLLGGLLTGHVRHITFSCASSSQAHIGGFHNKTLLFDVGVSWMRRNFCVF